MLFIFSTPVLIRHLWHLKTAVFVHWCLIRAVPLPYFTERVTIFTHKSFTGFHPSDAPFRCSTLGQAPGLTHKHQTRLARDKHSSLLQKSVNYDRKKFYSTGPWGQSHKTFLEYICLLFLSTRSFHSNATNIAHVHKRIKPTKKRK